MSIKTLFLILILHIFHEEEGYQASAELPNFSRFIFYFWEKRHLFKKKMILLYTHNYTPQPCNIFSRPKRTCFGLTWGISYTSFSGVFDNPLNRPLDQCSINSRKIPTLYIICIPEKLGWKRSHLAFPTWFSPFTSLLRCASYVQLLFQW